MSLHTEKLLELLSVDCDVESPYIIIKLFFIEESVDIKWKIDIETAKQLQALIEPNKNFKYRLSFQKTAIPSKHINYSWVTKTQGDKSENTFFPCSDLYVDGLEKMKACIDIAELSCQPSFTILTSIKKKRDTKKVKGKESIYSKSKRIRMAVALCVTLAFVLLYSGQSYHYEPALAKKIAMDEKVANHPETHKRPEKTPSKPNKIVEVKKAVPPNPVPAFHISKMIASSVPEGSVALTFDDGPSKHTKEIADILKANHAGGTFFFIGQNVERYPDMVQYVHSNGFSIGNHSMTHPDLAKLSYSAQQLEISKTNQLIEQLTSEPVTLFRPPYEANNQTTINLVQQDHLKMVLWDRDPRDWQTKDSSKILNYIKDNSSSGTIILLHESQRVVDILPAIINYLKSQQLQIVNLKGDVNAS